MKKIVLSLIQPLKRNILLLIISLLANNLYAVDIFVNPNILPGAVPNTYTTLVAALNASNNGDRVFIKSGSYTTQAITLTKSLIISPDTSGGSVTMSDGFYVEGFAGMKLQILGITAPYLTANPGSPTSADRAKIYVIDCHFGNLSIDQNNYDVSCARTWVDNNTTFRKGSFVISKTNNLYVNAEPGGGNVADTINKIMIVADTIAGALQYNGDNFKMLIANNLLNHLWITKWNWYTGNTNYIINNEFVSGNTLHFPTTNVPYYNFDVSNNIFSSFSFYTQNVNISGMYAYCNSCTPPNYGGIRSYGNNMVIPSNYGSYGCYGQYFYCTYSFSGNPDANSCPFPNIDVPGVFRWSYNGFTLSGSGTAGNLGFVNIPGSTNIINSGNPESQFYDIDLTLNDRGREGGPYSILNYLPSANPFNSKAFIFDLEIPTTLQPSTQSIKVRAQGYHRN
ncbi:hypothetical protein EMGBS15_08310 [Filimonas sp.]|nr:hypothetical protein EMGBS15_08310 [Filimonas sp.]